MEISGSIYWSWGSAGKRDDDIDMRRATPYRSGIAYERHVADVAFSIPTFLADGRHRFCSPNSRCAVIVVTLQSVPYRATTQGTTQQQIRGSRAAAVSELGDFPRGAMNLLAPRVTRSFRANNRTC